MAFSPKIRFLPNLCTFTTRISFILFLLQGYNSENSDKKGASPGVKGQIGSHVIVQPPPTPATRAKLVTDPDWIRISLERHNYLRSLHGSQPLTLNTTLCEISQAWANHLLSASLHRIRTPEDVIGSNFYFEHNWDHNQKHFIGENLLYLTHSMGVRINGSYSVNRWYEEIKDYDFNFARVKATSRPRSLIGHFTQLVWNASSQMGTALAMGQLPGGGLVSFIVANYYPSGNVVFRSKDNWPEKLYVENVVPPLSNAENEVEDVDQVIRDKIKFWEISTVGVTTPQYWIDVGIEKHNEYRSHHGFPTVVESPELTTAAQFWAGHLVQEVLKEFNKRSTIDGTYGFQSFDATVKAGFGENVIYFVGDEDFSGSADRVVTLWYEQHQYFDFVLGGLNTNLSRTAKTADIEQIMWKPTTHLGMAWDSGKAENGQIITFVVAFYHPGVLRGVTGPEKLDNLPTSGAHKMVSMSRAGLVMLLFYCELGRRKY